MISTSKDQSARLLALGVPAESADMCWVDEDLYNQTKDSIEYEWECNPMPGLGGTDMSVHFPTLTPAWSLSALMEMLFHAGDNYMSFMLHDDGAYSLNPLIKIGDPMFCGDSPIECCVRALTYLHSLGYGDRIVKASKKLFGDSEQVKGGEI